MSLGSTLNTERPMVPPRQKQWITPRQEEILSLMCLGLERKQIAKILGTSDNYVRDCLNYARDRTDSRNTIHLIARYYSRKVSKDLTNE